MGHRRGRCWNWRGSLVEMSHLNRTIHRDQANSEDRAHINLLKIDSSLVGLAGCVIRAILFEYDAPPYACQQFRPN